MTGVQTCALPISEARMQIAMMEQDIIRHSIPGCSDPIIRGISGYDMMTKLAEAARNSVSYLATKTEDNGYWLSHDALNLRVFRRGRGRAGYPPRSEIISDDG
uniref:hypothetical protein n=2 Tax=Hyphomonas atlantica TaxID=1280948 RepID=UPI003559898B